MKRLLLTMGGKEQGFSRHNSEGLFRNYNAEADRLIDSGKSWDLECIKFDNSFILNSKYYPEHKDVLDKVSFGFAFRIIEIYETIQTLNEGDSILFLDSNHVITKDPSIYYDIAGKHGVFIHDHIWVYYPNKDWTRRDTFINMDCDSEKFWNAPQCQGNVFCVSKNDYTMKFLKDWLDCALNPKIMFGEGKHSNFPTFKEHRHDQSIYSVLREKYGFPYVNRSQNVWLEYVAAEMPMIETTNEEDRTMNLWRKEMDSEENK